MDWQAYCRTVIMITMMMLIKPNNLFCSKWSARAYGITEGLPENDVTVNDLGKAKLFTAALREAVTRKKRK